MSSQSAKPRSPQGFTLLELLIAMVIIAILMSLTLLVMNGLTDQALREATKATVQKINGLLQQRMQSFDRAFKHKRREKAIQLVYNELDLIIQTATGRLSSFERKPAIPILARKLEFRFQFPQRVQDRLNAPDFNIFDEERVWRDPEPVGPDLNVPGLPTSLYETIAFPVARTQLISEGQTPSLAAVNTRVTTNWANHNRNTESAELLYFALVRSENFGASTAGADEFSASEIADTDNDGLPEFVDAWGNPLRFYRWPTRLVDHDAPVPFAPDFSNQNDDTDTRVVTANERRVAGILLKGLPPAPATFGGVQQREFLLMDPDDPIGLLYTLLEDPRHIDMGLQDFINEDTFHTIDTYHTPLIVSAGVDATLGLYEPWRTEPGILGILAQPDGTNFQTGNSFPTQTVEEAMLDNITNRNRRAGGR